MHLKTNSLLGRLTCKLTAVLFVAITTTLSIPMLFTSHYYTAEKASVIRAEFHFNTEQDIYKVEIGNNFVVQCSITVQYILRRLLILIVNIQKSTSTATVVDDATRKQQIKPIYLFSRSTYHQHGKTNLYVNVSTNVPLEKFPLHALSTDRPYRERLLGIRERCKTRPGKFSTSVNLGRFVNDDRHGALLCVVPKNACTTWKAIMMYLKGKTSLSAAYLAPRNDLVLDYGKIKSIRRHPPSVCERLFNENMKFMVTRHPFHRLVSAYRNKFGSRSAYWYSHGRYIARTGLKIFLDANFTLSLKSKTKVESINEMTRLSKFKTLSEPDQKYALDLARRAFPGNITFEEFLRYGVVAIPNEDPRLLDPHWQPQSLLCNPCAINFDFIIRFENLRSESERLLGYLQQYNPKKEWIHFPNPSSFTNYSSLTKSFFQNIPRELVDAVKKVFQYDFYYFGYNPEQY